MKRTAKIFLALIFSVFVISIVTVAVSADEGYSVTWVVGEERYSENVDKLPDFEIGDFAVYNGASYLVEGYSVLGNTVTITVSQTPYYYSITEPDGTVKYGNAQNDINTAITDAASGSYIKLLGNIKVTSNAKVIKKTLYIDLNGFNYVVSQTTTKTNGANVFSLDKGAQLYVYSTREGGKIFNASYQQTNNSGTVTSYGPLAFAVATVSGEDSRVFFGEFGKEGSDGYADGDNLSVYCSILVELYSYDTDPTDDLNNVNIKGGSYFRVHRNHTALVLMRDSAADPREGSTATIDIDGATLWAHNYIFGCSASEGNVHNKKFSVKVSDSVIQAGISTINKSGYIPDRTDINIYDSYVLSSFDSAAGTSIHLHPGCRVLEDLATNVDGCYKVRIFESKTFDFGINTFSFTLNDDKTEAFINDSSFIVPENLVNYRFIKVVADDETSADITWKFGDMVKTERWFKGAIPISPIALPEPGDAYMFTFGNITPVKGDKTYVAGQVANFPMKINLSLYSDFLYNLYIPAEYHDYVVSVGASDINGNEGEVVNGGLVTIYDVPYYKYSYGLIASKGAEHFYYDITLKGYGGENFTQKCAMSIPAYSKDVLLGSYNDSSKALVIKTLAYIRAACQYFGTDYSIIDKVAQIPNADAVDGIEMGNVPASITEVIASSRVVFGDQLKFRYILKNNADLSVETKISYRVGNKTEVVTLSDSNVITEGGVRYYEITLRASDMRSDMVITRKGESFVYNLAKYIHEVKDENDYVKNTLLYNLWDYSLASEQFKSEDLDIGFFIGDTPVTEYKIVADEPSEIAAANILAKALGDKFGYKPEILPSYNGKSIIINLIDCTAYTDFVIYESGGNLIFDCTYKSFFDEVMTSFTKEYVVRPTSDIVIEKGFIKEYYTSNVYYSDFGVVGDGVTNDFFNIQKAHEVANAKKYNVIAEDKTYYISTTENSSGIASSIVIKTNTDFGNAEFIIDDTNISKFDATKASRNFNTHVFNIKSDYSSVNISEAFLNEINAAGGIDKEVTRFDFGLGYPAMLVILNENNKQYIRYGTNANSGAAQKEVVVIDENGFISEETPLMFDFAEVTKITAYRLDVEPITVEGGTFKTLASQVNIANGEFGDYISISRGITIGRPNTSLKNITHIVEGEIAKFAIVDENSNLVSGNYTKQSKTVDGKTHYYVTDEKGNVVDGLLPFVGHSYGGFYTVSNTSDVTIENCVMHGRMYYLQGTYDINVATANNVSFINCTQPNFFESNGTTPNTSTHWGVMGSNYSKNIVYDRCMLTRYDAHCGVLGGKILNSTVSAISIIGAGDMLIDNTTVIGRGSASSSSIITLRPDYGSTWDGTITLKDCTFDYAFGNSISKLNIVSATYTNHYFGYETHLPNIIVDNLKFADKGVESVNIYSISIEKGQPEIQGQTMFDAERFVSAGGTVIKNLNPYHAPDFVIVKNNNTNAKYVITDSAYFDGTSLVGVEGGTEDLPLIH